MSQDSKTRPEFNDAPSDDDETLSIQTIIERLKRRSLASAAASNKAAENGLPQPLDAVPSPAPAIPQMESPSSASDTLSDSSIGSSSSQECLGEGLAIYNPSRDPWPSIYAGLMSIRPALSQDAAAIAAILMPVIRAGETYALDPAMTQDAALAYWFAADKVPFVFDENGVILGTYYLRANQAGGGDHVANAGYMTSPIARGKGIARAMALHAFDEARARGFTAMQFNFVVASNTAAVHLWTSLGFATVGRVPGAFRHPRLGSVDALVMHRPL